MDELRSKDNNNKALETARLNYQQGKYAESLEECERAEAAGIRSPELAVAQSRALLALKRRNDAEAFIMAKLEEYPTEAGLYYNLIVIKLMQRKLREAEAILEEAEHKCPGSGRLAAARTMLLVRRRNFYAAVDFATGELEKFPDEPLLHYYLGYGYAGLRNGSKSREQFRRAVELDESLARTLKNRRVKTYAIYAVAAALIISLIAFKQFIPFLIILGVALLYGCYHWFRNRAYVRAVFSALLLLVVIVAIALASGLSINIGNVHFVSGTGNVKYAHGLKAPVVCFAYDQSSRKLFAGGADGHVYRLEGGTTWSDTGALVDTPIGGIAYNPTDSKLYAGDQVGRMYSYSKGQWSDAGNPGNRGMFNFAYGNRKLYAVCYGHVSSTEDGTSWASTESPEGAISLALAYDPADSKLYAGFTNGHVFSYDGTSWTDTGPLGSTYAWCIAYNAKDSKLYAGSGDGGVYRYDGATSWTNVGDLGRGPVNCLAYNPTDSKLYAGGSDNVYSYDGTRWHKQEGFRSSIRCLTYNPSDSKLYAADIFDIYTYGGTKWSASQVKH